MASLWQDQCHKHQEGMSGLQEDSAKSIAQQNSDPSIFRPDEENFPYGPSSVSRSFELLQLASVQTFQQHVRTILSVWPSIRQVSHSKFRRLDSSLHGPDARASDMEIACIWSTVQTTIPLVRTCEALIQKLRVAKVRPSGRQGNTVRMWLKLGKNFSEILESRSHSCLSRRPMTTVQTAPRFYQARISVEPEVYK
jgi:hypothetical protein